VPQARPEKSTTICKATGKENAQSDSGPLKPAFEKEADIVWRSVLFDVRHKARLVRHRRVTIRANLYRLAGSEQRFGGDSPVN
jgi:hypothetical protein